MESGGSIYEKNPHCRNYSECYFYFELLLLVVGAQYCEESRVYNCDSRSGELEKVLAAHKVSPLTSVYLVTDLRHSP